MTANNHAAVSARDTHEDATSAQMLQQRLPCADTGPEYCRRRRPIRHARGYDSEALARLSQAQHDALLAEASVLASAKLAEVEARWRYLHERHEQA